VLVLAADAPLERELEFIRRHTATSESP
jgi:hypothetical protein